MGYSNILIASALVVLLALAVVIFAVRSFNRKRRAARRDESGNPFHAYIDPRKQFLVLIHGERGHTTAGITRQEAYRKFSVGYPAHLVREPNHTGTDPHIMAMACSPEGQMYDLGLLGKEDAETVSREMEAGNAFWAWIAAIGPSHDNHEDNVIILRLGIDRRAQDQPSTDALGRSRRRSDI